MKLSAAIKPLFANRGHFRSIRHDQIRDLFAEFLTEVCPNMSTELALQPISRETFPTEVLILMMAQDWMSKPRIWDCSRSCAFFDVSL